MTSTITATNAHGAFTADAAVVDRLVQDHGQRSLGELRRVLAETTGLDERQYSDVVSKVEALVMLADALPPMKPAERRYAGIRAVVDSCFDNSALPPRFTPTLDDVDDIVSRIRELSTLGRSQRWRDAVEQWSRLVEMARQESPTYLKWAVIQGSILVGHEAE